MEHKIGSYYLCGRYRQCNKYGKASPRAAARAECMNRHVSKEGDFIIGMGAQEGLLYAI